MKNTIRLFTLATGLTFIAASAVAVEFVSVNVDNANVRRGPAIDEPVVMELYKGYPLKILKTQGEWYKVADYERDTGWIHKKITSPQNTIIVNAKESMNLREKPSTRAKVVASVERGVVMQILQKKGKWYKVRHSGGTVGWIWAPLVWPQN